MSPTQTCFVVGSSHGELLVNRQNGEVQDCQCELDINDPANLSEIRSFDVKEYHTYHKKVIGDYVDILDLGYWNHDGEYTPAVAEWRTDNQHKL